MVLFLCRLGKFWVVIFNFCFMCLGVFGFGFGLGLGVDGDV